MRGGILLGGLGSSHGNSALLPGVHPIESGGGDYMRPIFPTALMELVSRQRKIQQLPGGSNGGSKNGGNGSGSRGGGGVRCKSGSNGRKRRL